MKVENNVALVTGANRGIGRAIVEILIASGASKVYAAVRDLASAQPLVDQYGDKVVPIQLDLSKPTSITAAAAKSGDVTILVNNAGILKPAAALDSHAIESLQLEIEVNVFGLMRLAQAFAPVLKSNGGGVLVHLNSVASMKNFAELATYSASKAASYSITQALREQLESQGTAVISVHPGPIATDMAETAGIMEIAEPPSVVAKAIVAAIESGDFHVFPDTMAKQLGEAYASYAKNVIEAQPAEG